MQDAVQFHIELSAFASVKRKKDLEIYQMGKPCTKFHDAFQLMENIPKCV